MQSSWPESVGHRGRRRSDTWRPTGPAVVIDPSCPPNLAAVLDAIAPPHRPGCLVRQLVFVFFFQAEDGIRDIGVTGVQTCALPICAPAGPGTLGADLAAMQLDDA